MLMFLFSLPFFCSSFLHFLFRSFFFVVAASSLRWLCDANYWIHNWPHMHTFNHPHDVHTVAYTNHPEQQQSVEMKKGMGTLMVLLLRRCCPPGCHTNATLHLSHMSSFFSTGSPSPQCVWLLCWPFRFIRHFFFFFFRAENVFVQTNLRVKKMKKRLCAPAKNRFFFSRFRLIFFSGCWTVCLALVLRVSVRMRLWNKMKCFGPFLVR